MFVLFTVDLRFSAPVDVVEGGSAEADSEEEDVEERSTLFFWRLSLEELLLAIKDLIKFFLFVVVVLVLASVDVKLVDANETDSKVLLDSSIVLALANVWLVPVEA
jgi:hypothetical protein